MSTHTLALRTLCATIALLAIMAIPAHAQTVDGTITASRPTAAQALRAKAASIPSVPENWREIRKLYEQAARSAGDDDIARSEDLRLVGLISFYLGDVERAQRSFIEAARTAAGFGDVYRASHAYMDAALVTAQLGDGTYARSLLERAQQLSNSPLLEPPFCDCLRERIMKLAGTGR